MKAIFFGDQTWEVFNKVYSSEIQERLKEKLDFNHKIISYNMLEESYENLMKVDFIFSTWGMPTCSEEEIKRYFPALKAVFYGAGTV
ncbi:MAG TPA: hypothetical protein VIK78_19225 [Ruminiclostridium sp.]